jgi:hypothetical protein
MKREAPQDHFLGGFFIRHLTRFPAGAP